MIHSTKRDSLVILVPGMIEPSVQPLPYIFCRVQSRHCTFLTKHMQCLQSFNFNEVPRTLHVFNPIQHVQCLGTLVKFRCHLVARQHGNNVAKATSIAVWQHRQLDVPRFVPLTHLGWTSRADGGVPAPWAAHKVPSRVIRSMSIFSKIALKMLEPEKKQKRF